MAPRLQDFIGGINIIEKTARGTADTNPEISGLCYDSREAKPGCLFFALPGIHANGSRFIADAVKRGAACVVYQDEHTDFESDVVYLKVADARLAMAPLASAYHGDPARSLAVVGVTGTEGKSTTVYLVYQLLCLLGKKAGFISTVQYRVGAAEEWNPSHQTTPEATSVQASLAAMRDYGMEYAVIESSSHGLSERTGRLSGLPFDAAIMTNVTLEHLEFHKTLECYRNDKANLFRALDRHDHVKTIAGKETEVPSFGVVNASDPVSALFRSATAKRVFSFSTKGDPADLAAADIRPDLAGVSFTASWEGKSLPARIDLPGAFNVDNVLASVLCASRLTATPIEAIIPLLPRLRPVRGRMTRLECGQDFEVIVDYAHTPSSFEAIFPPLRASVRGKIISLFGSGGERDREKRPLQGRVASRYSDIVILADEDPRGEEPLAVLEEIAAGCAGKKRDVDLFLIPDRPSAIRRAFSLAQKGDAVLLLGKGHENSIIGKTGARPYDEIAEAKRALAELGFEEKTR
jgi:UDP-N-acetylmuramoyl-L-alanyl-D-glutamate--2,6-diaminopimelate ligase